MPSPAYFLRQADICLRLSLVATDPELATRLLAMAEEYKAKANSAGEDGESEPTLPDMVGAQALPDREADRG
ncbi:MAG TPA: hypothetical protein VFB88_17625 [Xanthobacteraceae bacterium]|nr:hypothetical protein [Xanthobacteraceae bacterium]